MLKAPSLLDVSFGRSKIKASGDCLFVGAPRTDNQGKVYVYHNNTLVKTISKPDKSSQEFGNIFGVRGDTAVVVVPYRPGLPAGAGGVGPSTILSPTVIHVYKRKGAGKWTLEGETTTTETHFGDKGVVVSDGVVAIASSGEKEKYKNTCINVYNISGGKLSLTRRFYPENWGPLNDAYRFSGFDYKQGLCIGLWNDGLGDSNLSDRGPLRVWTSTDTKPARIQNKALTQAKIVNNNLIVATTIDSLITYTRSGSSWNLGKTMSTGKFIRNAIAVNESGTKVAVRVYAEGKNIVLVFGVEGTKLTIKRGVYWESMSPVSAGLDISENTIYAGLPGEGAVAFLKISSMSKASYANSVLKIESGGSTPGSGPDVPGVDIGVPGASDGVLGSKYSILEILALLAIFVIIGLIAWKIKGVWDDLE